MRCHRKGLEDLLKREALSVVLGCLLACSEQSTSPQPAPSPVAPTPPSQVAAPPTASTNGAKGATDATPDGSPSPDASGRVRRELRFKKGKSSTTVQDAVIRGERHWFEFGANADQQLDVSITALEDNAVFGLYVVSPYGWQDRVNEDANVAFRDIEVDPGGSAVGVDAERTSWSGKLPYGSKSGQNSVYAIEVGGTRGNASYTLKVSIK